MKDLEILLENKVGQLALLGKVLGEHKLSLEGGGVFQNGNYSTAHFLVKEPEVAASALQKARIKLIGVHEVLILKLRQDVPGQLGSFCSELASVNVNILHQYSDHYNQLILVVDNYEKGKEIADRWMEKWWGNEDYCI